MKRKLICLSSGYHARLRTVNRDFFPPLHDVDLNPRPGFDLASELCSRLEGLDLIQAKAGLKFHVRPESKPKMEIEDNMIFNEKEVLDEVLRGTAFKGGQDDYFYTKSRH
jgi:hypothetical protein